MKKLLIIAALALGTTAAQAQVQENTLSEFRGGTMGMTLVGKHMQNIDTEAGDTSEFVLVMFRDATYSSLVSFEAITLHTADDLTELNEDLSAAMNAMGTGKTLKWKREGYYFGVEGNGMYRQYLELGNGEGYTYVTKRAAGKLADWLKELRFTN